MFNSNQLRASQPVVIQTLENALKTNRLSHALLFNGPKGTPKKEVALWLAQCLVCENPNDHHEACGECEACLKIQNQTYADLKILDGTEKSIKKEEILEVQHQFSKTALEKNGKKIYILDHCENATPVALNSLLKFLEEPEGSDTIAILLTDSLDAVLPTIVSRCQILPFKPISLSQRIDVLKQHTDDEQLAYLVANMTQDSQEMMALCKDENFLTGLEMAESFLSQINHPDVFLVEVQNSGQLKKETMKWFIEVVLLFLRDALVPSSFVPSGWYQDILEDFRHSKTGNSKNITQPSSISKQIQTMTAGFLATRDKMSKAYNVALLMDQLIVSIKEELV